MKLKNDRPQLPRTSPPRKRFRIERLEERIAPKKEKGGNVGTTVTGSDAPGTVSY